MKKIILITLLIFSVNCNGYKQGCAKIDMTEEDVLSRCGEPSFYTSRRINGDIVTIYSYTEPTMLSYIVEIVNNKVKSVTIQ